MTCRHGSPPDKCRICSLEKQLADQKVITELAVKGLKDIKDHKVHSYASSYQLIRMSQSTLSEIARLQNAQT